MRAISSSKFRDMMSSFIDTIIQEHQDSRGAVADEDLLDVLLTVLRTQREDELLDPPSPARTSRPSTSSYDFQLLIRKS